jgi:hypothetical protein
MARKWCPTCKGRGHNGPSRLAAVGDNFRKCGICKGKGSLPAGKVKSYKSVVTAMFLLKDGSLFEMELDRNDAAQVMVVEFAPQKVCCELHHIDQDGIFHYEEAEEATV